MGLTFSGTLGLTLSLQLGRKSGRKLGFAFGFKFGFAFGICARRQFSACGRFGGQAHGSCFGGGALRSIGRFLSLLSSLYGSLRGLGLRGGLLSILCQRSGFGSQALPLPLPLPLALALHFQFALLLRALSPTPPSKSADNGHCQQQQSPDPAQAGFFHHDSLSAARCL